MTVTATQLKAIAPTSSLATCTRFEKPLNDTLSRYSINTPLRIAHFLAQVLHESGALRYTEELASGSNYEGRKDLGNTEPGDGIKFKGRGLIQLTGRANYAEYGKHLNVDLLSNPKLVATNYNFDVAGWFWNKKKLNLLADVDDIITITKRINGGQNGLADRQQYLTRAKQVLGL